MSAPHPSLHEATILFGDLRGFSSIAASYPPEMVFDLLNRCFITLTEIAARHQGTVDKFIGDGIMVVFAHTPQAPHEDARRAVQCAVDMQIAMDEQNRAPRRSVAPELYLGVGINTGRVIAGRLGSDIYSARTVIGEEVNLAARIEPFCLRGQILVSEHTYELCGDFVHTGKPMEVYVKGRSRGLTLREVRAIPSEGKEVPRQERRRSPRVPVRLPFSYQLLARALVSQARANGIILDIGYHGVLVELDHEVGLFEEIKLDLELPIVGYRADDVYGRIVSAKDIEGHRRFGVEFTSVSAESSRNINRLVHMLIQGMGGSY